MKEFYEDFIKLQSELPSVMKSAQGQAGQGKFKYADLTEIVNTVRPLLAKHGFAFMQLIERSKEETPYLKTILIHKSGNSVTSETAIDFTGEDIKKFGAAITYYRRYTLQSMLGIVADDDVDSDKDTISKTKSTDVTKPNSDQKLGLFCIHHIGKYSSELVTDFLKARSGHNKKSIDENISEFTNKDDAFFAEIDYWKTKHNK